VKAKHAEQTDLSNSERFVREHAGKLRFVGSWQKWIAWNRTHWSTDLVGVAEHLAKGTVRTMLSEASTGLAGAGAAFERADEDADLLQLAKERQQRATADLSWALESHSAVRLGAMVKLARSAPELAITHEELDTDPWRFNVANGTIDLRTGALRPHDPKDLITKIAPIEYDPSAKCPTWDAFLDHAQRGNSEMLEFIRRAIGYCLTGVIRDHILLFLYGPANTGKSTFFRIVHELHGSYGVRAPRSLLFASRGERHPTELATLHGARFVSCNEIDESATFDEALVKDLTGGENIATRRMREDFWTFRPTHKLAIGGNYKPRVRNFDDAIRRRLRLIPWVVKPAIVDTQLFEKLRAELPGILAWAVRGCLEWQRDGLGEPVVVRDATDAYQDESDPLREFFDRHCIFAPDERIARRQLRFAYEEYAKENGAEPLGAKRFAAGLRLRGAIDVNVRHNGKVLDGWGGVRLATEAERDLYQSEATSSETPSSGNTPTSSTRGAPHADGVGGVGTCEVPTAYYQPHTRAHNISENRKSTTTPPYDPTTGANTVVLANLDRNHRNGSNGDPDRRSDREGDLEEGRFAEWQPPRRAQS
jgi:putative DNA primase/helicase